MLHSVAVEKQGLIILEMFFETHQSPVYCTAPPFPFVPSLPFCHLLKWP